MDNGRTDNGPWLYYKLTNEPKDSCELKIKKQVYSGCFYFVYTIDQPFAHCVSSFNFEGLTEKCDKKFNVLEFERKLKK